MKLPALPIPGGPWVLAGLFALGVALGAAGAWWVRGFEVRAAEAHGQAVAGALVAAQERARAEQASATLKQIADVEKAAKELNDALQVELDRIRADAAARPRVVRVPVAARCPQPAAGGGGAGAPAGRGAGAAADGGRMGGDGSGGDRAPEVELDVAGIWQLVDAGRAVSERLRAAQAACR